MKQDIENVEELNNNCFVEEEGVCKAVSRDCFSVVLKLGKSISKVRNEMEK